ncbi:MAG: O-antigen ligase family protein [Betaproteobacteria bacterium]|nr:O-antigen ligase family protein [Betaproteobacteria bacterium]
MIDRLLFWQPLVAAAYLALLPTHALTFWRSTTFALGALLALAVAMAAARRRAPAIPAPPRAVTLAFVAWGLWSTASLAWSVHPDYTAVQLRREVAWTLLAAATFFVACSDARTWRGFVVTALGSFVVLATVAGVQALTVGRWNAGVWHGDVGLWSTWLVLVAPFTLTLLAPPPGGFADRRASLVGGVLLLALLLAAARATDNRMVWIALAAVFATASLLGALRWRASLRRAPLRWLVPLLCLLVALGALFADAVREKAQQHHPPQTSVAQALATDPRIVLWDHTVERIRERPWTGFGFGRGIIGDELRAALRDPLLAHAHNVFVSQWLQTGAPGFALLVALLTALATAHAASLRSADPTRALLGVIGLSLLAGFVVKNLTDDFFFGSNAREFWALNAILLGYDARLRAAMAAARSPG